MFMCDGGILSFNTHYSYTFDLRWADLLANTKFNTMITTKLQTLPIGKFVNKSLAVQKSDFKKKLVS